MVCVSTVATVTDLDGTSAAAPRGSSPAFGPKPEPRSARTEASLEAVTGEKPKHLEPDVQGTRTDDLLRRQRVRPQRSQPPAPVRREQVKGPICRQRREGGPQQAQEVRLPETTRARQLPHRPPLQDWDKDSEAQTRRQPAAAPRPRPHLPFGERTSTPESSRRQTLSSSSFLSGL